LSEVKDRARIIPKLVVREPPPDTGALFAAALAGQNPVGMLLAVLTGSGEGAKAALGTLLRSLVEEGGRFAATPAGRRWAEILVASPAVERGWLLWSHTNIDALLRNAAVLPDSPAALLEGALRQLAAIDMARLMSELSRLAIEIESDGRARSATS
jgi:hypothetical protein